MTHEKNWEKYDQPTCQAIIRELPKTWSELWRSPVMRMRIKSRRTLTEYLRHLRKTGAVKRTIDEEKNKIVYMPKDKIDIANVKEPRAEWVSFLRMRRHGYDLEELYWGGQELGMEEWWKEVQRRAKQANSALRRAVDLWFEDTYGEKFTKDKIGTIVAEMTELLLHSWFEVALLYLTMIFRGKRESFVPSKDDARRIWLSFWYRADPEAVIWETMKENLGLLTLAIRAGYFSLDEVQSAIADMQGWLLGEGFVSKETVKGTPIVSLQDAEISDLIQALRGDDLEKKAKAEQILFGKT